MYVRIGARIKQAREEKFLSQAELGAKLGVTATAINYYEKGKRKITVEDLYRLAAVLERPLGYFLPGEDLHPGGKGCPDSRIAEVFGEMASLPVVGEVRAGEATMAEQNITGRLPFPREFAEKEHFALKVTGDSMAGQGICEGDLVLIRRQAHVDYNGQVVAALVNGEETTLKFFYREAEGRVRLKAANPCYPDIVLEHEKDVLVQGVLAGVFKFPPRP